MKEQNQLSWYQQSLALECWDPPNQRDSPGLWYLEATVLAPAQGVRTLELLVL